MDGPKAKAGYGTRKAVIRSEGAHFERGLPASCFRGERNSYNPAEDALGRSWRLRNRQNHILRKSHKRLRGGNGHFLPPTIETRIPPLLSEWPADRRGLVILRARAPQLTAGHPMAIIRRVGVWRAKVAGRNSSPKTAFPGLDCVGRYLNCASLDRLKLPVKSILSRYCRNRYPSLSITLHFRLTSACRPKSYLPPSSTFR